MLSITDSAKVPSNTENKIRIDGSILENSKINISGKNNIIYIESSARLKNSIINISGDNSVVFISKSKHPIFLNVSVYHNNAIFIDRDNYFNGVLNIVASSKSNVVLGKKSLFSFGIWLRTADPHLIYDAKTKARINPTKSIFIGDHVWLGQDSIVLKNTKIHSGSIIGAKALVSGKTIPSQTIWGGNPAKQIRDGIIWDPRCVHAWTDEMIAENEKLDSAEYDYSYNKKSYIAFENLDEELLAANVERKFEILQELQSNKKHNKFSQ